MARSNSSVLIDMDWTEKSRFTSNPTTSLNDTNQAHKQRFSVESKTILLPSKRTMATTSQEPAASSRRKKRIGSRITNWWKRHHFYVVHENTPEDSKVVDETFDEEASLDMNVNEVTKGTFLPGKTNSHCGDREFTLSKGNGNNGQASHVCGLYETTNEFSLQMTEKKVPYPLVRTRTGQSFQGSLESMDSVAESYWEPEDDESSEKSSDNNLESTEFLEEHFSFLRTKTKAKKVKVVWTTPP